MLNNSNDDINVELYLLPRKTDSCFKRQSRGTSNVVCYPLAGVRVAGFGGLPIGKALARN